MEELFINKTKYSKEAIARFKKFHQNKYLEKKVMGILALFILTFIMIVINIIYKNMVAVIGFCVFALCEYAYYFKVDVKRKEDNNLKKIEMEFTFIFTKQYVEIQSKQGKEKLWYAKIYRIYETDLDMYIYLNKEYTIILNKNGFIKGKITDFRKFIKGKLKNRVKLL